jgi:1-acyl-sn-glycerol-3-phosphate acyltransferase
MVIADHTSWLDIIVMEAVLPAIFVTMPLYKGSKPRRIS